MQRIHILRVDRDAAIFSELIDAMGEAGRRVGYLELGALPEAPPRLAAAAASGVLRAVAAGSDGDSVATVATKRLRALPVLQDLMREHFLGCALVLVRGTTEDALLPLHEPFLEPAGDRWRVRRDAAADVAALERTLSTEELVQRLAKVRPWTEPDPAAPAENDPVDDEKLTRRQRRAREQAEIRKQKRAKKRAKTTKKKKR